MYQLLLLLSRYFFLFYILFFLGQALLVVRDSRREDGDADRPLFFQRLILICMHYHGVLLLAYQGSFAFSSQALLLGAEGLAFLLVGFFVTDRLCRGSDRLLWNCLFFLLDVSLIMLLRLDVDLAGRQLLWVTLGLAAAVLLPGFLRLLPWLAQWKYLYLLAGLALSLSTLIWGSETYGSVNWVKIGSLSFQPSEIVKFLFVFYLAAEFHEDGSRRHILISGGYAVILVLLLVVQKDLGGALLFFTTYMAVFYIATSRAGLFFAGMGVAAGASALAYKVFSHVRVRVAAWRNPWADVDTGGYQIAQSLFAICSGGFWGTGLGRGMPKSIPIVEKDFIFSAICEELGVFFALGLLVIFLIIFLRGMWMALKAENRFYGLIAAGVVTMLAFQTFLIVAGNIKMIPLTGVTLPFVSYGGSSVVVSILMLGLLQWVGRDHLTLPEETEQEMVSDEE